MDIREKLQIQSEIEMLLVDYWYEVDHHWGGAAHEYFTQDGTFTNTVGRARQGRDEIREFYGSRQSRGARVARHVIANLRVEVRDRDNAEADWVLLLYARDGEPVLPSEPAILIADVHDVCVREADGRWRYRARTIRALFKSDTPTTT